MSKKYFWLKLEQNWFGDKTIKKLRRIAGGDTYVIIYLKMCLKSLNDGGMIHFEGVEDNIIEELSLELDEDLENVGVVYEYLRKKDMLEIHETQDIFLNRVPEMVGKETESARKMRKSRAREKQLGHNVTTPLPSVTSELPPVTKCDTEKRREREDIEIDIEKSKEEDLLSTYEELTSNNYNSKDLMKFIKYANSKTWITSYRFPLAQCADAGALLNACSVYSQSEICESIDNYDQLMEQGYDVPVYGNSITFLIKGIEKYLTSSKPFEKYRKKNQGDKPKKEKIDWTQYDD